MGANLLLGCKIAPYGAGIVTYWGANLRLYFLVCVPIFFFLLES